MYKGRKKSPDVSRENFKHSINQHIKLTLKTEEDQNLPFLDTFTTRTNGQMQIVVNCNPTHTDRFLDYNSHHPMQHKRSVVRTLLDRARNIPTTAKNKERERQHVISTLRDNNYPSFFVHNTKKASKIKSRNSTNDQISPPHHQDNLITLPYVQGVSEKISRVSRKGALIFAHKPIQTIINIFSQPKDSLNKKQTRGIVYKYECKGCDFVYYGETGRSLKTRIGEHRDVVRLFDQKSKAAQCSREQTQLIL